MGSNNQVERTGRRRCCRLPSGLWPSAALTTGVRQTTDGVQEDHQADRPRSLFDSTGTGVKSICIRFSTVNRDGQRKLIKPQVT